MVIVVDPGDTRKNYGKKIEYIAKIHEGVHFEDRRGLSDPMEVSGVVPIHQTKLKFGGAPSHQLYECPEDNSAFVSCEHFGDVYLGQNLKLRFLVGRIFLASKRFFRLPSFSNYALADGIDNLLLPDKASLQHINTPCPENFHSFCEFGQKTQDTPRDFSLDRPSFADDIIISF